MSVFNSTMRPYDNDSMKKSKKRTAKAEMRRRRVLRNAERHFKLVKSSFRNEGVLGKNAFKKTRRKRSLPNKKNRYSAQEA